MLFFSLMDMMNILKFCKKQFNCWYTERKELPNCGLIVSSRPHASVRLREQATSKVDILGFTETEREQYIKESLRDQQGKTEKLVFYLQSHSKISGLCFVAFNIAALVYLYKQGIPLPKNSVELYIYFIPYCLSSSYLSWPSSTNQC